MLFDVICPPLHFICHSFFMLFSLFVVIGSGASTDGDVEATGIHRYPITTLSATIENLEIPCHHTWLARKSP